ncbi:MAG: RNA 2'-phosphotransferase [Bacteroidota bacterium]|nr:RNA 2'-phosphotransferase [Bacteroidota bacterium]
MNYNQLSKIISHALRHEPWIYELELDEEGWVDIDQVIDSLAREQDFPNLNVTDISQMIALSDKKRHEIHGSRIRAIYGHSIPEKISHETSVPPDKLFHGTSPLILDQILKEGLLPMKRQYVHLSLLYQDAEIVGKRKSASPVMLQILANEASKNGVKFYKGNDKIWLADKVPAEFLFK